MAIAMHLHLSLRGWPGEGPVDRHFLAIAGNLTRAHDLIDQHLRRDSAPTPDVLADAAAARTRVLHALYVGSHAIQVAARAQTRDLADPQRTTQRPRAGAPAQRAAIGAGPHSRVREAGGGGGLPAVPRVPCPASDANPPRRTG